MSTADINTWEYDREHPEGFNTLKGDENFRPLEHDIPVERQRITSDHKHEPCEVLVSRTPEESGEEPEKVLQRRRSSVSTRRRSSRKATGSYGDGNLKPLSGISQAEKNEALSGGNPLFFTDGIPSTTSGGK